MADVSPQFKRIVSARTSMVLSNPFYGLPALQLDIREDPTCDTAWTDGKSLGFNPAFTATLSDDELIGLVCHEVMHCACGHPWRRAGRDHKRFNAACDYAINPIIKASGMSLPSKALLDPAFDGKWAEYIYDRLPSGQNEPQPNGQPQNGRGGQPQQQNGSQGQPQPDPNGQPGQPDPNGSPDTQSSDDPNGQPQPGEVRDAPTGSDAPTQEQWSEIMAQAERVAKARGQMPGQADRAFDKAKAPDIDWRDALQRYIQDRCAADYSWSRPNARYLASGLYLPALHSVEMGTMVCGIDVSGSVDKVLLAQFGASVQLAVDTVQPSKTIVVYCDSKVRNVDTFERGDPIVLKACGGGGTAFGPVFEHVDSLGETPAVLVYLTDLDGSFPAHAPDYPVLWAVYGGNTDSVPFGDRLDVA